MSQARSDQGGVDALAPSALGFDPAEVRRKYAEEREKRLRPDAGNQFIEVVGENARFEDDPYVEPGFTRKPMNEDIDVAILGGGFGGLLAAARLQEAGISNVRIIEKAGDFGGTWYWNRYPGAQCDIESYIYLPLLDETGYVPKEKYSFQPEIFEHAQRIGQFYDLYPRACFQTQVTEARWSDDDGRWTVKTDRDDVFRARFLIMSSGPLNRPRLPGIPGINDFKGHIFHTSRWDYDYTGGGSDGLLDKLGDKRVGIIGTGATAIQAVPRLAKSAQQLYVFQRTPSFVDERWNRPTDPQWAKSLKPGWQADRNENFCSILAGLSVDEDLVQDKWTDFFRLTYEILAAHAGDVSDERMKLISEVADYKKGNDVRERVQRTVEDPATAEVLKPWFGQWCKRPLFNDEYLPCFNQDNVQLVDTHGRGVERITEKGVVVDGVEYEVDCLVLATGFEVSTAYTQRSECEVYGRDGVTLTDYWADGMKTFHGFLSQGFPNCFHMGLTQTGLAFNFTYSLGGQARHIAYLVKEVFDRNAQSIEPTPEAEADWVKLVTGPSPMREYQETCTPGYYNQEGKNEGQGFLDNLYPEGAVPFFRLLDAWRSKGTLDGIVMK